MQCATIEFASDAECSTALMLNEAGTLPASYCSCASAMPCTNSDTVPRLLTIAVVVDTPISVTRLVPASETMMQTDALVDDPDDVPDESGSTAANAPADDKLEPAASVEEGVPPEPEPEPVAPESAVVAAARIGAAVAGAYKFGVETMERAKEIDGAELTPALAAVDYCRRRARLSFPGVLRSRVTAKSLH
jgi:hypothetical protein